MIKKNLLYFGTPHFSAEILKHLLTLSEINVVGVVTQPDKPQGRKQTLTPSAVAQLANDYNLPVYKPQTLDQANLAHLRLLKPDITLVVSYGKIIPQSYLDLPLIGTFNLHFSLLPKYRGALCISEAIKNQDSTTGVTLMQMDAKLDHGPIISQATLPIDQNDDVVSLTTKLTHSAKELLTEKIPEICAQSYTTFLQDESLATFTPSHRTLTRQTAFIPFETLQEAIQTNGSAIHALIRSLNPEPGAWTQINGNDIKILKTELHNNRLILSTIQQAGKSPISWTQFLAGHSKVTAQ